MILPTQLVAAALDAEPPDHLEHDTIYHGDRPYMHRYYIVRSRAANIRLHHIMRDDAERDLHDHPWDFTTHLLSGGYREHLGTGEIVEHHAPCTVHRRATDAHRLELLEGPMWTLIVTGPWFRTWGFHTADGWVPWRDYQGHATTVDTDPDRRPHSRACGIHPHPHGYSCHPNCPTCGGK